MLGVNKVILIGCLGKDPEIRYLEGGISVVSFTLATSEVYAKEGKRVEQTEWHNIVIWRSLADQAVKFLKKGSRVYLEGKLRTRSFEDKTKLQRYQTEVVVDHFTLLDK